MQRSFDQVIDEISIDQVTRAEFAVDARARAAETVESFRAFLDEHQDEITALQVLYSRPYAKRLTYRDVKELAEAIGRPPHRWTPERLWEAYETLDASKVRGSAGTRAHQHRLARPVHPRRRRRAGPVPRAGRRTVRGLARSSRRTPAARFTDEQLDWLRLIRDHLAASLSIEPRELLDPPFSQRGGLGRARELFGQDLDALLAELTEAIAA